MKEPLGYIENLDVDCVQEKLLTLDVPSYEKKERDGYPIRCIKCNADTIHGVLYTNMRKGSDTVIGLGCSACEHCKMRYSASAKNWQCWQVIETDGEQSKWNRTTRCDNVVEESCNYICDKKHVTEDNEDYTITKRVEHEKGNGHAQKSITIYVKYIKPET